MAPLSPTVAAWDLGLRLKERRELLDLRGEDIRKATKVSATYLSSVEKGKKHLSEEKLQVVAAFLEFGQDDIAEMLRLRSQAVDHGWWSKFSALFPDDLLRLFGFEHGAESIRTYSSGLVYGMLQTERVANLVLDRQVLKGADGRREAARPRASGASSRKAP